ncbi:unnamed protein product [Didymodactylos carnosus]|uniref:Uncharacterized protein n=1 Tax=Didymodactylos carnosus TaxID=1234261 RepID=A0A815KN01_9BILA|nr:unnamed protein product [Didymodactylos carnosus]CAF1393217.1 unnamed protein product [Didymodactylos carnosus]CAF4122520.1 unnamed protein product [Didymodactylos carnosus]CAF4287540.1 unnamed protein product [Didymodactylos carnosus]
MYLFLLNLLVLVAKTKKDNSIRVNVGKLIKVIENGRLDSDIKTKIVGGSTPPPTSRVWEEWKNYGYKCILGARSWENKEVFLDDMLHAQILTLLTDHEDNNSHRQPHHRHQQVLVLVTGDGNDNYKRGTSFPAILLKALKRQWHVELWSWEKALNGKFLDIQKTYPKLMKIKYFDLHRKKITFTQKQTKTTIN